VGSLVWRWGWGARSATGAAISTGVSPNANTRSSKFICMTFQKLRSQHKRYLLRSSCERKCPPADRINTSPWRMRSCVLRIGGGGV
jgi:hypothetical protein